MAFLGLDGAGKSTMLQHTFSWISGRVRTRRYYLGNAEPSWLTLAAGKLSRAADLAHRITGRHYGERSLLARISRISGRALEQLALVSVGRDRFRRYLKSLREAALGTVILYDRYPLEPVHFDGRMIDGPKIAYLAKGQLDPLGRKLATLEETYYRRIQPPDRVLFLQVSPKVAEERKPEHDFSLLEAKSHSYRKGALYLPQATIIDADQPFDQVLLDIKTALWDTL